MDFATLQLFSDNQGNNTTAHDLSIQLNIFTIQMENTHTIYLVEIYGEKQRCIMLVNFSLES